MANEEHLKILQQGVEAWNRWRVEHPGLRPDLSYTNLHGAQLSFANFAGVDFIGTDLGEAALDASIFFLSDLSGSNLKRADLYLSKIIGSHLEKADLTEASLNYATLSHLDLDGTNFNGATLNGTTFSEIDLSTVIGLETVKHDGPSTIGINTLYLSNGKIPEAFLRGCGVSKDFIAYARSLVINPIEYYSCFISYSSKDSDFADRLHADLQAKAIRCWYAPEDLKIGDKFRTRIEESIRIYDKVMVVLSENSIQSAWVEEEVEAALERERQHPGSLVLFPIRLDDAVMETKQAWAASLRRIRHIGDFSKWKDHDSYQKAFERLLRDLKSQTKAAPAP